MRNNSTKLPASCWRRWKTISVNKMISLLILVLILIIVGATVLAVPYP